MATIERVAAHQRWPLEARGSIVLYWGLTQVQTHSSIWVTVGIEESLVTNYGVSISIIKVIDL